MPAPMSGPRVPPKGWERPLDTAPDQEIEWYNSFVRECKERGKAQFPGHEDAWKKIIPKLKFTGNTTSKIYNHFLGKVPDDELVWGHLVAALIMFGAETVKGSASGKKIQAKYPMSDITRLAHNEDF